MSPNNTNAANTTSTPATAIDTATGTAAGEVGIVATRKPAVMNSDSAKAPPGPPLAPKIRNPYLDVGLEDVPEEEEVVVGIQGRDVILGPYAQNSAEEEDELEQEPEPELGMLILRPNLSHTPDTDPIHSNQVKRKREGKYVGRPPVEVLFLQQLEADEEDAERQDMMGCSRYNSSLPGTRNPYLDRMDNEEVEEEEVMDSGSAKALGKTENENSKYPKSAHGTCVNPYLSGNLVGSKADAGPSTSAEEPKGAEEPELKVKLSGSTMDGKQVERQSVRRMVHFKDDDEDQTPKQKPQHREASSELSSCTVNTPSPLGDNASNDPRHPNDVYSMGNRELLLAMDWDNGKAQSADPKKRKLDAADASHSAAKITRPESPDFIMVDVTFAPKGKEPADPRKSFSRSPKPSLKPSPRPKASPPSLSRTRSTGSPPTPVNARQNELGPCPIIMTPGWKKLPVSSHNQQRSTSTTVSTGEINVEPRHSALLLDPSLITDMSIMELIMDPEDWWFLQRHQKLSEEERPGGQQPAFSRSNVALTPKPGPGPGPGPGAEPSPRRGRPKLSSPKNNPDLQAGFLQPLEAARRVMHVLYTYETCSKGRPGLGLNEEQKARLSRIRSALQTVKPILPGSSTDPLKSQSEDDQQKGKSPAEMLDEKFGLFQSLADTLFDSFVDAIKDGRKLNKKSAEQDPQLSVFLKVAIDEVSTAVLRARKRCTEAMHHQLDIEKLNLLQSEEHEQQQRLFAATQSEELRIAMLRSYGKVRNGLQERSTGQTTIPAGYHLDGMNNGSSLDMLHDV